EGDTLEETMGKYLKYINPNVRILMVSSGGDDFLGDLLPCLNLFDPDHTDPKQAAYYLAPYFDDVIKRCDKLYRLLAQQVHSISPTTQIVVHGYDLISPWCHGIFIGVKMDNRGLETCWSPNLCEAIIHLMINRFNNMLANLSKFLPNFTHVDLRGTLKTGTDFTKSDIFDELHPKSDRAKLLADKMAQHL